MVLMKFEVNIPEKITSLPNFNSSPPIIWRGPVFPFFKNLNFIGVHCGIRSVT